MAPRLRVLISSSTAYPPTAVCPVNSPMPTQVRTANFEGEISVFVRDFTGEGAAKGNGQCYFGESGREDMTYGIVVRGRYLDNPSADDVVFGNIFEFPIRDSLPWGTAIATKFMYFIDPTLKLDVYADKPWALSPAVATMNHLSIRPTAGADEVASLAADSAAAPGPAATVNEDALSALPADLRTAETESQPRDVRTRRRFFADEAHRKFPLDGEVGMEFSNGILDFNTLSVQLPRPFAIQIPLLKYWDGQPVTYVCRRRVAEGESPVTPDGIYWAVAFEIVDEDAKAALAKRGGSVKSTGKGTDGQAEEEEDKDAGSGTAGTVKTESAQESASQDVD